MHAESKEDSTLIELPAPGSRDAQHWKEILHILLNIQFPNSSLNLSKADTIIDRLLLELKRHYDRCAGV